MSQPNTSGIRPLWGNVLVLPEEVQAQTKGGLLLPDEVKERDQFAKQEGVLIAKGPGAFVLDWPAEAADQVPAVGDRVFFSRYRAVEIRGSDGKTYWMMKDEDVAGVMQ